MEDGQQAEVFKVNIEFQGQRSSLEEITNCKRVDLRLGIDHRGEFYLLSKCNGKVYQVVDCREQFHMMDL